MREIKTEKNIHIQNKWHMYGRVWRNVFTFSVQLM